MNRLIAFFAKQRLLGNLFTFFVILVGIYSAITIRREIFPNVTFDIITITTLFPSASPSEVEKLITNPLEQDLQEVDGIKKLTSTSVENRSVIVIQLDPDQTSEAKGKSDVQDVVDRFELPTGAEDPIVTSLESKQSPIIELSLAGKVSDVELRNIAKSYERELELVPGVARVVPRALRDREIWVETDPKKLALYRLSLDEVVSALGRQNVSIPAGTVKPGSASQFEKIVRTLGEFESVEDVEKTVIRANDFGAAIRIRDVAKVFEALEEPTVLTRTNGLPSLTLTVLKKEKADAIELVDAVRKRVQELQSQGDARIQTGFLMDMSMFIRRRISILTGNLVIGLVLVLTILGLLLPFRTAAIVSVGIPFSFLGAMIIFNWTNSSLNLISLIGLIIVTGMLVDDAIVVTDNSVRLMEEGHSPEEAAIKGAQQIWPAVTASVLTTVFAFLPMLFMSGIFGKFIKEIPLGVIAALMISLFEAFLILPQHFAHFMKPTLKAAPGASRPGPLKRALAATTAFWENKMVPMYARALKHVLRFRYAIAIGAIALFAGSLVLASKGMKVVMFPPEGIEIFFVRIETPTGTPLERTAELIRPIEKAIAGLPDHEVDDYLASIGLVQQDPNDPETRRGGEYAQIAVYLPPETDRERTAAQIIEQLRKEIGLPPGLSSVRFDRVRSGPPVGKPVSVGIRGAEYEDILPAAKAMRELVSSIPGVSDIADSYIRGKEELQIRVNGPEAAAAGLSAASIGATLRGAFDGIVATSIQELEDEVDIRVRYPQSARAQESTIEQVLIPNPMGALIPLSSVAKVTRGQGLASYNHESNRREVRVTGDINTDITSATAVARVIQNQLRDFQKRFPNVTIDFGGEEEDTQESFQSLGRAFIIALIGIFMILVAIFRQVLQPVLVVLTIPLGVMSVIWTFFLHGLPLSFMGMLGIIALAGVIVNNAIVFVDFVNQQRAEGADRFQSILAAGKMRIRPIFLTTVTTVSGLLPTAYGLGGLDKFVVPIALALGWGMLFGSILTSIIFPAAIAILDDLHEFLSRLRKRTIN